MFSCQEYILAISFNGGGLSAVIERAVPSYESGWLA
jgi:hypothetical protein